MKNFKKVLAVLTAVSAMAASTSAFAANVPTFEAGEGFTATDVSYEKDSIGAYKLTVKKPAAANTDASNNGGDMTLLVLKEGTTDDILYIDQGTTDFTNLGLKTIPVTVGEDVVETEVIDIETAGDGHVIKVGYYDADGHFTIAKGYLTVEAEEVDDPATRTFKVVWGDTTGDNKVDGLDSVAVLKSTVGIAESYSIKDTEEVAMSVAVGTPLYTDGFIWGNVNNDEVVDGLDSVAILKATVGIVETYTFNGANVSVDASETPSTVDIVVPVSTEN